MPTRSAWPAATVRRPRSPRSPPNTTSRSCAFPPGTRNHFALDLGIDRRDVVGALDAFVEGTERRIDLGRVNGRVFLNNVAMGMYGAIVESPEYREHKIRTVIEMLPDLLGPDAEPFDLRFVDGGGRYVRQCRARAGLEQPRTRSTRGRARAREATSTAAC